MLEELHIRDVGVIPEAQLRLGPGFTAITGETGAGKTMILTGLGMLLGTRVDSGRVRHGAQRAQVDAVVHLPAQREWADAVRERLAEVDADLEDDALLVSRTVVIDGRGRAVVGGRPVPVSVLGEVMGEVVTVHGQADQRRLLLPSQQRMVLDRFAGAEHLAEVERLHEAWHAWREQVARLEEFAEDRERLRREADDLRDALARIDAVAPEPGEDEALREEISRLAHVESLRAAAQGAHDLLVDPEGERNDLLSTLATARRMLDQERSRDAALAALADTLAEQVALVADLAGELAGYVALLEDDPQRLGHLQQRNADINALLRRFAPDLPALLAFAQQARERLAAIDDDGTLEERLRVEVERRRAELDALLASVSDRRHAAATELGRLVSLELADLAMASTALQVRITDGPEGPSGRDDVDFLLASASGAVPLRSGASGGELSRVMLAIEVVVVDRDPAPVLVFDEVDAGVGGRAAIEVGRRLARLSRAGQVLVVTHLAQVAAFADHHLVVEREDSQGQPQARVRSVAEGERVSEIARMLAGLGESSTATAHAAELLDHARQERATSARTA